MTDYCHDNFGSLKSVLCLSSGTTIVTLAVYWIIGGMYTIMDITNKPAALRRYKIQPGTNEPVDPKRLMKASNECL
jgi:methylsterol monooxygenase